ncbi:ABC transporter ATP-binding protein [Pedobacter alpinus]|uniref:ABC transporter ATP-binding protein n=1 Tax=Pedobacter alpinus TaxID=1590643 RepID=A0ABW5TP99_9SPHI
MGIAIKVENLSKAYQLGEIGTGTLSNDLKRWAYKVRGKDDPFLKIGETNERTTKGVSNMVWSLKDLNFEINQGDAVGIIGRNGAGKSTLLKILSRVTSPTTGSVKIKGRVASLLEVGTGFHPELTGRENIFLNGAILGMRKAEIKKHFEAIVDFAGVERYIDTPVKRYSSGMYVRLAFAVAAHLESEILVVDEVLAVGDAEFQKKCLGKMNDVSKGEGRTVLFVSHNLLAVKSLCSSGILLGNGILQQAGKIETVVNKYIEVNSISSFKHIDKEIDGLKILSISSTNNGIPGKFNIEVDLDIEIILENISNAAKLNVNLFFNTADGSLIFASCSPSSQLDFGKNIFKCTIPANTLNDNIYSIDLMVVEDGKKSIINLKETLTIEGIENIRQGAWLSKFPGLIRPLHYNWTKEFI